MAVVSVTKVHNERIVRDASGVTVYENYRVETGSLSDDITLALTAVDPVTALAVPSRYATKSVTVIDDGVTFTGTIPLKSIEPTRTKPLETNVLVTYAGVGGGYGFAGGPITEHGSWNVDFSVEEVEVQLNQSKDNDGNPIVNSAGEPIDPGLPITKHDRKFTISYNTRTPPIAATKVYIDCINSTTCSFTINGQTINFDENSLKFIGAKFSTANYGVDPSVWKVELIMYERPDGYLREWIDEGTYYIDSTSGDKILAPNGQKCYLDGAGGLLPTSATSPYLNSIFLEIGADFSPLFAGI